MNRKAGQKAFPTLRRDECASEALKVLQNAKAIWCDAKILEGCGSYARALSLEVFALEELTKALILLVDSHGFNLRKLKNLKVLSKDHQQRHVVIMIAAAFDVIGKELQKAVRWAHDNQSLLAELGTDPEKLWQELGPKLADYYREALGPAMIKLVEWAAILGDTRTDGIYTEYRDGLYSPLFVGKEEYLLKKERLEGAYRALRTGCVWLLRGGEQMESAIAPMRPRLQTRAQYSKLDQFCSEHLRDRAVFDRLAAEIEESLKNVSAATRL
jgi:AbiV family abortive infection protein